MKTAPIIPACSPFGANPTEARVAGAWADSHLAPASALARAHQVYIKGNDLPGRWQGRSRFVVLEIGFGLGHNFLATWDTWRRDPQRCDRLHFVAIENHPARLQDLQQAHAHAHAQSAPPAPPALPALSAQLLNSWPVLTPNVHRLEFDSGRVTLLLALGDVAELLPGLRTSADAFFLNGFAPACNPDMWQLRILKALYRQAAPGATLAACSTAPALHADLTTAGFAPVLASRADGSADFTRAVHRPRAALRARSVAASNGSAGIPRTAVVIGAGLAGAAAAQALAHQGLQVTVLETCAEAASRASGNAVGLFHGTVNGDDGRHARLHRAAALMAERIYASAITQGVPGQQAGLLRLEQRPGGLADMEALIARQGWPVNYVQALSAAAASQRAGVPLSLPAWFYPGGGWISPPLWVQAALLTKGVALLLNRSVQMLQRVGAQWQALGGQGQLLAQSDVVVLAHAQSAAVLVQRLGHAAWPLHSTQGQLTQVPCPSGFQLQLPVAGDGYVVQLAAGQNSANAAASNGHLWCGASSTVGEPSGEAWPAVTADAHWQNLQRLHRLTSLPVPQPLPALGGRAGWRLHTSDGLPIAGQMPLLQWPAGQRQDQPRLLPREPGLFVLTALGARGLTLAPLLAQLVAAQAVGAPWPLEQDLADAVDPARWRVRSFRKGRV